MKKSIRVIALTVLSGAELNNLWGSLQINNYIDSDLRLNQLENLWTGLAFPEVINGMEHCQL